MRWAHFPGCLAPLLLLTLVSVGQAAFVDDGPTVLGVNLDGRSASLGDYDNDGDLDLFFQGGTSAQRFFRNNLVQNGVLSFTDVSSLVLPAGLGSSWSAAWGDYNGDGRVDIFVGQSNIGASGDVLRNDGLRFANASTATGLNDPGFHQNVAWNDIDNDHDLDLILGMEGPEKHEIYLQQSNGTFTPVGGAVGFQADVGTKAYGMAIGDTDGDGDLDIYISTCRGDNNIRNNFFENRLVETGTLSFVDIADANGTQNFRNSYGAEFLDFDDDGDLDLFTVGADAQPTKIFRNDGGNQFTDVDMLTGHPLLSDVSSDLGGGRAVDYDNDGDLDLYFHDHLASAQVDQARKLYRNDGNWQFTDVTTLEGLDATNEGAYDSAWADIDRDGDQDLIAPTDTRYPERVFVSDSSTNGNQWLYVQLSGRPENTTAIGATLYATINEGTPGERTLRREANTNAGTFNQSDLPVHFGLGGATQVDQLRIVWPDGTVQFLFDVPANQYLAVTVADPVPGDFNYDGVVDAADYTMWRDQLGRVGAGNSADGDANGVVDAGDYLLWRMSMGGTATAAAAVPEPAAVTLLLTALLMALPTGRRTRTR